MRPKVVVAGNATLVLLMMAVILLKKGARTLPGSISGEVHRDRSRTKSPLASASSQ